MGGHRPLWRRPWFFVLAAAAVALGALGVHGLRVQAIRARNVELEVLNDQLNESVAERQRLIDELELKNAELERFTYTVSHDLKSPLVTIAGFLGFLEQDAAAGNAKRMATDVARIKAASRQMARLLDELLELSRIGRVVNPSEEIPLSELAREAVSLTATQIAEHGVEVEIAPRLPVVFGDRTRLLEVLQNLVVNAVKFMGDQPRPRIEIGARRGAGADDGEGPVCFVRDNGMGIEPEYHEKVFGLFERLEPGVSGTGIGLALVRRIVEFHGGRIWVESEGEGRGSTFCFTLPRETTDADGSLPGSE